MQVVVPKGGRVRESNGFNDGLTRGQSLGAQRGRSSIEFEQIASTCPLTHSQVQEALAVEFRFTEINNRLITAMTFIEIILT